jgi:hypothetical protein
MQFVNEICCDYAPIEAVISPAEFAKRWRESVCIADRVRIETQHVQQN